MNTDGENEQSEHCPLTSGSSGFWCSPQCCAVVLGEKYQNRASMKWCFSAEKLHTSQKANFQACDKHTETEWNSLIGLMLSFLLADVNLGFIISFSTAHPRPFIFCREGKGRCGGTCGARPAAGPCTRWWLYLVAPSGVAHHSLVLSGLLQGLGPPAKEFLKLKTIFLSEGLFPPCTDAPLCGLSLQIFFFWLFQM